MKKNYNILYSTLIAIPVFIFEFILFSFNTNNADMLNYIARYNNIKILGPNYFGNLVDIGFNYLMHFFIMFGFNYQYFLISIGIIIFFLLNIFCSIYNINKFVFFVFFGCSVFFIESVIVRQFLSSVLLCFAFIYIDQKNIKSFRALSLILLASSIHITAFIGFLYYFTLKLRRTSLYLISVTGFIFCFITISKILPILTRFLGPKFALYSNLNSFSLVSLLAKTIFLVVTIVLFLLMDNYYNKYKIKDKTSLFLLEISLKTSLINVIFLPLMVVDVSFERLLLVPIFLHLANVSNFFNLKYFSREKIVILFIIIFWILLAYRIFVWSDSIGTIEPILHNNMLWE